MFAFPNSSSKTNDSTKIKIMRKAGCKKLLSLDAALIFNPANLKQTLYAFLE